jgi:hypothetical protein
MKSKDQASSGSITKNECNFCKKHKWDFQGHTYKNCLILKQLKEGTNNNTSNQSHLPPQPTGTANLVTPTISTTNPDPENESYGIAYIASSSQAFINTLPIGTAFSAQYNTQQVWVLDTGASHHITADFSLLHSPVPHRKGIKVGGGNVLFSTHRGMVKLLIDVDNHVSSVTLSDWNNGSLISWSSIDSLGTSYLYARNHIVEVRLQTNHRVTIKAVLTAGIYRLSTATSIGKAYIPSVQFSHTALGHSSIQSWPNATKFYTDGHTLPKKPNYFLCSQCALFNSKHQTLSATKSKAISPYDLIHTDLARPFSTQSLGHASYYMILIDDFSRFTTIYFLKCKGDATHYLKQFCEIINNQTGHYPHAFRSDQGGEYINDVWDAYCINKGITHQTTTAYALESNGIPKRLNLMLAEVCRTSLADLPSSL